MVSLKNIGPKTNSGVFCQGGFGQNSIFLSKCAFLILFGGEYFDFQHGNTLFSFSVSVSYILNHLEMHLIAILTKCFIFISKNIPKIAYFLCISVYFYRIMLLRQNVHYFKIEHGNGTISLYFYDPYVTRVIYSKNGKILTKLKNTPKPP